MTQLPTPPASRQSSELPDSQPKQLDINESTTDLLQSLDAHLEKYLHLLDKHQSLQSELASKLSSGFLSLAHANYTCPPGRRYGEDYYDDRMKASKRVTLHSPSLTEKPDSGTKHERSPMTAAPYEATFAIDNVTVDDEQEQADTGDKLEPPGQGEKTSGQGLSNDKRDGDTMKTTATSQDSSDFSEAEPEADAKPEAVQQQPRFSDPIRWFGILVPPTLRRAQKSFSEAIEGSVPQLASITVEMQAAEKEVYRLRRQLGRQ